MVIIEDLLGPGWGSLGLGKEESPGEKGQPHAILAWPSRCPHVRPDPVSGPAVGFWNCLFY